MHDTVTATVRAPARPSGSPDGPALPAAGTRRSPRVLRSPRGGFGLLTVPLVTVLMVAQTAALHVGAHARRVVPSGVGRWADALRRDGEEGAELVEYLALIGVAVAICAALAAVVGGGIVDRIVGAVVEAAVTYIGEWIGG